MLSIIILILFIHNFVFGLGLGLDLKKLASVSASRFWPRLTSLPIVRCIIKRNRNNYSNRSHDFQITMLILKDLTQTFQTLVCAVAAAAKPQSSQEAQRLLGVSQSQKF